MSATDAWLDQAFFEEPVLDSLDGGTTSEGPLWHAISPRWGHTMHTMCAYHGMFPARLVHHFIQTYSKPGDLILDPFSGRGTTALQASVEGRRTISNDLSPLGYVLSAAKSRAPSWQQISEYVDGVEKKYRPSRFKVTDVSADIRMLYHDNTLRQLLYLREHLLKKPITDWNPCELMLAGSVAGILHGSHRSDNTSMYLSISMPNTFSMPPAYVRKFIRENGLVKLDQDVFDCLREQIGPDLFGRRRRTRGHGLQGRRRRPVVGKIHQGRIGRPDRHLAAIPQGGQLRNIQLDSLVVVRSRWGKPKCWRRACRA